MSAPSACARWSRRWAAVLAGAALLGCGDAPDGHSSTSGPVAAAETRAGQAPALVDAGVDAQDFRAALEAGAGRVRVVALVSPT